MISRLGRQSKWEIILILLKFIDRNMFTVESNIQNVKHGFISAEALNKKKLIVK